MTHTGFDYSPQGYDGSLDAVIGRTLVAAVVGGTASEISGGKFANGAMTAAMAQLFNQEASARRAQTAQRLTLKQQDLARAGKTREFWVSRLVSGDPIAPLALEIADNTGLGKVANDRLLAFAKKLDLTIDLEQVMIEVMRTHADIT